MKFAYLLVVLFTLSSCASVVPEESSEEIAINNEITPSTEAIVVQDSPEYLSHRVSCA